MLAKSKSSEFDAASDAELLDAWVESRDRDSLTELIGRYQRLVMAICLRQCRRRVDVEDAFQATFLQLSRSADRIQNPAALAGWLHAVAYRVSVRTRNMVEPVSLDRIDIPSSDEPLTQLARRHELQLLDEEIERLPETEKTPMVMHYLEELTVGQIASKLGTTSGSIRGRLQRGRKRLRGRMVRRGVDLTAALAACELLPIQWIDAAELTMHTVITCNTDPSTPDPNAASDSTSSPSPRLPRLEKLLCPEGSAMFSVPTIATGSCITGLVLLMTLPTVFDDTSKREPTANQPSKISITSSSTADPADENNPTAITPAVTNTDPFGEANLSGDQNPFSGQVPDPGQDPFGTPGQPGQPGQVDPFGDSPSARNAASAATQPPGGVVKSGRNTGVVSGDISPNMQVGSEKIQTLLNSPYRLAATDVPLPEFVDFLQTRFGLPVTIDQASLNEAEISDALLVTTPVTEANLSTILRLALNPLGLRATIDVDVLEITVDPEAHALNGGDMCDWISVDDEVADGIIEKMEREISKSFQQIPLEDAVLQISQEFDLPFMINTRALEDEGLTRDLPVTAHLKNISLESFLNIMFRENDLTVNIYEGILVVTTATDAGSLDNQLTRLYWLDGTGVSAPEDAINLLTPLVAPNSWEKLGGPATLQPMQDESSGRIGVMINQTFANHRQIERLFDRLRDAQRRSKANLSVPINP